MTLNLSISEWPSKSSDLMVWMELTLELQERLILEDIEATKEVITKILDIVDQNPAIRLASVEQIASIGVQLYLAWLNTTKVVLETKEDFLKELNFLYFNYLEVNQLRLKNFLEGLFGDSDVETIRKKLTVGSKTVSDYLYNHTWVNGMKEDIYEAFERYIHKNMK